MKKTLLFILATFFSFNAFAQQYEHAWEVYHSGYQAESRGIGYIGILNSTTDDVAWTIAYDGEDTDNHISEVAYTNDGGVTWTAYDLAQNVLPGIVNPGIGTVFPVDANTAFIAAYHDSGSIGNGGIWKTTDAGATWTKVSTPTMYSNSASFCNLVYFFDSNNGFCQGDPVNGEFEMYYTTNGGTTWIPIPGSQIDNPNSGEFGYVHGFVAAGNTVWFTTSNGRLYRSTDQGHTWTAHDTPLNDFGGINNDSGDVTFKDDNEGWLVRDNGELYHTTDAGDTWTPMTPTYDWTGDFFGGHIAYIPGTTNTLVVTEADALNRTVVGAAISEDGGQTWTKMIYYNFDGGPWEVLQADGNLQHLAVAFRDVNFGLSGGFSHVNDPNDPDSGFTQGIYKYVDQADVSVANETIQGLSVYPNPADNFVQISTENAPLQNVTVFDVTGKEVMNLNFSANNTKINVSALDNGIYLMKITDTDNNHQAVKLVIK